MRVCDYRETLCAKLCEMAAERHFTKMPDVPQGMEALMRIENAVMLRKFQWQG